MYGEGGHVRAIHSHRHNAFFASLDIASFFPSIGRNRVRRVLAASSIKGAERFAKWSTVRNPADVRPQFFLPYGFPQSPLLATLVLQRSPVGELLRSQAKAGLTVSVYVDDISLSHHDAATLRDALQALRDAVQQSGLSVNDAKTRPVAKQIRVFNCDLSHGRTEVTEERSSLFYSQAHGERSIDGFRAYCLKISEGNF